MKDIKLNDLPRIKHLCFDLDDTLYEQLQPFQTALQGICSLASLDIPALYQRYRIRSNEFFDLHQQHQITMEAMHLCRIKYAFADVGIIITDEQAQRFQQQYQATQDQLVLSEATRKMLDAIKAKQIRISLITNGPVKPQWKKIHALGLTTWIDPADIIISEAVGYVKPDKRIFHLLDKQAWFIGDSYEKDMMGAKNAGWNAIWLNKNGASANGAQPDIIVHTEEELCLSIQRMIEAADEENV